MKLSIERFQLRHRLMLQLFCMVLGAWPVLGWSQVNLLTNGGTTYNPPGVRVNTYGPVRVSCASVNFSVNFRFSLPWPGNGNMESNNECPGCAGDPEDPTGTGCGNCWDFLWVRFMVNGVEVAGDLIGAGNNQQMGTISASNIPVNPGDQISIEIHGQTWASGETITTSEIRVTGNAEPAILNPIGPFCNNRGNIALSTNQNGITGVWSGRGVTSNNFNPTTAGAGTHTLTFTPNTNQCATPNTIDVEVNPAGPADLSSLDPNYCQSNSTVALPTLLPDGVTGNWSGTGVSGNRLNVNAAGTRTLTFTPTAGQCATLNRMDVEILAPATPSFANLGPFCPGQSSVALPTQDDNGTVGTWTGTGVSTGRTLNTSVGGTGPRILRFIPGAGQCAVAGDVTVQIQASTALMVATPGPFCTSTTPVALATTQNGEVGNWSGTGVSGNRLNIATPGTKTITFTPNNACINPVSVNINVGAIDLNPIPNQNVCGNSFTLPNLTSASPLNGSQAYFTGSNGTGTRFAPGSTINSSQTLFSFYQDGGCSDQDTFTVTFIAAPSITPRRDTTVCGALVLPPITGTNLSANAAYYTASLGGGTRFNPGQQVNAAQTLFVYDGTPTCFTQDTFRVNIVAPPRIDSIANVQVCNAYVLPNITGTGLSPNVAYYTGPNGTGTRYLAQQAIVGDLRLYAFDQIAGCSAERTFLLDTITAAILPPIRDTSVCGSLQLPPIRGRYLSSNLAYFSAADGSGTRFTPGQTLTQSDTLFAFDRKGGCVTYQPFRITVSPGPQIALSVRQPITCNGANSGALELQVSNGLAPLNFRWSLPALNGIEDPGNLLAGTYSVTVTDGTACAVNASIILSEPNALSLSCAESRAVSQVGGNDGAASIMLGGGAAPYRLELLGAQNQTLNNLSAGSFGLSGLSAGVYRLGLSDSQGCRDSCQFTITQPNCTLAATQTTANPTCAGTATGQIQISPTSGAAPIRIDWNVDALDGQFNPRNLAAGIYIYTLSDNVGCQARDTLRLTDPPQLRLSCAQLNPTSRVGGNDGAIRSTLSGGAEPFSLSWTGPSTGSFLQLNTRDIEITGLPAGTYLVVGSDNNGCRDSCSTTITQPTCTLDANIRLVQAIRCSGRNEAVLAPQIRNAQAPLSINWTTPSGATFTQDTLRNLSPGRYLLRVADNLGCVDTSSFILGSPPPIQVNCIVLADASTIGGREGRAVLRFQGGTGVLALDWGGSQPGTVLASGRDSLLLGNLPRGTYSPNFIDVNGCRETCSFSIVEPTCNLQARLQPQNPTCAGASNGQIVALLSGGRSPYTFRWSNAGPNKDTLFNLAAGTYQVTVSDAINCQVMLDTVLRDPSALDFRCQVVQQVRTLNGREGRARLIFGGGNAPYNFTVQGPVSSTQTANAAGSFDLNELSVGTYNVTLRDSRGCQQVCSFQISEPTCNLSIQLRSIAPNCQGAANGQVEVLVTGGRAPLQYDWSDNSQDGQATARNLRAGTYSVIVTDSIGCVGLDTVSLREPSALSLVCGSPQTTSTVGGQDGSILLRFSGGTRPYTLVLSGTRRDSFVNIQADSLRVTGLAKGNYRLSLRDANACSAPGCDFSINDPACNLELRLIGVNNPCAGRSIGNILASVNGAVGTLNYDWSDNRFDGRNEASGLRSGVYQLIVTDARLCRDTATYTVTEPSELRVDCQIEAQPTTVGGSEGRILYTVTGGTGVMSTRFSGSSSGVFGDAGGGVYLYSSLRAGTYQFVVTDLNGCTDTCVSTLQAITCNLQGLARTTNPSCHNERNGSISIEVSGNQGAVSYLWAGMIASGQNPRTLPSGTYRVTLTDAARCTDTLSITLSNPPALSLTASAQVQPTPANPNAGTALVNYTGGRPAYTLLYYLEPFTPEGRLFLSATEPGSSTLSNLRAGTYTLVLSDRNGCRDTTSLTLQEPPCTLAVDISSARADCESSHLSTSVSGGTAPFQYNWSPSRFNGQANPRNAAPGQYQLRVVDASGCLALDSITLALDPQALRVQAGALNPACPGDLGAFALRSIAGGQGPFTLSLNAGNPQRFNNPPFTLRNLNPGNYTLRLSNAAGCGFDTSFTISPPRALSLELGADTTLKKGTRYTFAPQVNFRPVRITWAPLEGLSATEGLNAQVQPKFSTAYTLQLRDSAGCEVNDRILITVAGQVEAYFPSAFSPNEDDINDFFSAYANADIERIEVLRIFDRWGGLVFEGKDIPPNEPSQGWDGRSRGQAAPAGVYVYHSVLRLREGSTYQAAGEVILLR